MLIRRLEDIKNKLQLRGYKIVTPKFRTTLCHFYNEFIFIKLYIKVLRDQFSIFNNNFQSFGPLTDYLERIEQEESPSPNNFIGRLSKNPEEW